VLFLFFFSTPCCSSLPLSSLFRASDFELMCVTLLCYNRFKKTTPLHLSSCTQQLSRVFSCFLVSALCDEVCSCSTSSRGGACPPHLLSAAKLHKRHQTHECCTELLHTSVVQCTFAVVPTWMCVCVRASAASSTCLLCSLLTTFLSATPHPDYVMFNTLHFYHTTCSPPQ
jgi:hypothetical protein